MLHVSEIAELMQQSKCNAWSVKDLNGNDLFEYTEDKNIPSSTAELEKILNTFKNYKRVVIWAGDDNNVAAKWRGCYKWTVCTEDKKEMAKDNLLGLNGKDYVHRDVMEAKLALVNKEHELNDRLKEMERKIEDGKGALSGVLEKIGPLIIDKMFPSQPVHVASLSGPAAAAAQVSAADKIKFDRVEHLIDNIFQRGELDVLVEALEAIDAKPELLKTAASLIK